MDLNSRLREREAEISAVAAARDAARDAVKVLEAERQVDKKPLDPRLLAGQRHAERSDKKPLTPEKQQSSTQILNPAAIFPGSCGEAESGRGNSA